MNLAQLRAFASVAEAGSVTGAAARLGLSQSAVSHALASLERELGSQLVVRDRACCSLTQLGVRLLPDATEALRHADRIAEVAAAEDGLRQGRLRVGTIPSASTVLLPLISQFKRSYPGVSVAVFEGTDSEVSDWIEQRTVEVGVVTGPRPGLEAVPLAEDEMLAVVPSGHQLASRESVTVPDLASEPFLLSAGGCEPVIRRLHDQHHVPLAPVSRVTDMTTLLAMVREGLGVSIVPALSLPASHDGITAMPLRPRAPRSLLLAAKDPDPGPAARTFLSSAVSPEVYLRRCHVTARPPAVLARNSAVQSLGQYGAACDVTAGSSCRTRRVSWARHWSRWVSSLRSHDIPSCNATRV